MKGNIGLKIACCLLFLMPFELMANLSVQPELFKMDQAKVRKISGNWQFFWEQFIPPVIDSSFCNKNVILYANVPSYWNDFKLNGINLPGKGYGSFSRDVLLPAGYRAPIGVNIPSVDVAYRFYINGVLQAECGKISSDEEHEIPDYNTQIVKYFPKADTLHLVFHVSNFHHRRGGLWKAISIGPYNEIQKSFNSDYFFDLFSLGVLIAFGLFFLIFSFYYRSEKSILYLSVCFLFIFLRGICTNFYPIKVMFPISWIGMIRLEYIGDFVSLITGGWGFFFLNPITWVRKFLLYVTFFIVLILGAILLLPAYYFGFTVYIFYALLFICLSLLTYQIYLIIRAGRTTPILYIIGLLLLFLATLNDILVANSIDFLFKFYILPRVFLIFIFILSIEFFRRFVETFNKEKELTIELAKLNSELQMKVDERTARLLEKRRIIESQNELLQKDIFLKNRILSIIGHDIRSPLSFLLMGLDLVADEKLPLETRKSFFQQIVFSANNLFLLIDNLLSWGMSQNKQLKIYIEKTNLSVLAERVISQYQQIIDSKEIVLVKDIPPDVSAWFDENTIMIVLRNLLSNAVKFTPHKGTITMKISEIDNFIEFKITDTGIGIPPEKLKLFNEEGDIISSEGTNNEKGTGLGLILCKELVALNGGLFSIQSIPNSGSIFSFTVSTSQPA